MAGRKKREGAGETFLSISTRRGNNNFPAGDFTDGTDAVINIGKLKVAREVIINEMFEATDVIAEGRCSSRAGQDLLLW